MKIITDNMWNEIESLIPRKTSLVGRPEVDPRKALDGMMYVLITGIQWKYLPMEFGATSTIHGKFMKWSRKGIFEEIMQKAIALHSKNYTSNQNWFAVDTSHTKSPFANWSGKNPTDRGKRGVKKIMLVDWYGAPMALNVAPSNTHDSKLLTGLIDKFQKKKSKQLKVLAADSAFDVKKLFDYCKQKNIILFASTNVRRTKKRKIWPSHRWVIERSFGWFVWYRSLKTCWTKTIEAFKSFLEIAASIQLFKRVGIFG